MGMTVEEEKAWNRAFELAGIDVGIDLVKLGEIIREAVREIIRAWDDFDRGMQEAAALANDVLTQTPEEISLEEVAKCYIFGYEPTTRKKKQERDRRRTAKQTTASRFRQYKARESAWAAQKRTGPRRREWRGPWKEN